MDKGRKTKMDKRILIASPVHQKEEIFKEYLFSLNKLLIPSNCEVNYFFILHNCKILSKYLRKDQYIEYNNNIDLNKEEGQQKQWEIENYNIVADMRTKILQKAREEKYDYLFMVDSDVLLHPKTLSLFLKYNKDIIASLSWTKLNNNSSIDANCAQYEGWNKYNDIEIFKKPNLYKVGWTGRCTLISSKIFSNPNISYYQIPGVDNTGSEDYAFCLRCYCNFPDLKIYFDTMLPSRHLYQEKDYKRWIKEKSEIFKI